MTDATIISSSDSATGNRIWAVVPAAGIGRRMAADRPKQYLDLAGRTVIAHTLDSLCRNESIDGVIVGIAENDGFWPGLAYKHAKLARVSVGGIERMHTVLNALLDTLSLDAATGSDWVMVHDAARPCVSQDEINRLISATRHSQFGAILALPVADTIKKADDNNINAVETLDRSRLWRALTPQMFRLEDLIQGIESAIHNGHVVTDESAAMERLGFTPKLVEGSSANIKITTPSDLALAHFNLGINK